MKLRDPIRTLLCLSSLCLGHAIAQKTLHMDTDRSQVRFTLKASHAVHGSFKMELGTVTFDDTTGEMSGNVVVDAASGQSGNPGRDKKMTDDELRASSFSTITFSPKHFAGKLAPAGDSTVAVDGTFTLLGTAHEITVPMKVHRQGNQMQATGSFTVPYVRWGLKDPSIFFLKVAKDVTVQLSLIGELSPN